MWCMYYDCTLRTLYNSLTGLNISVSPVRESYKTEISQMNDQDLHVVVHCVSKKFELFLVAIPYRVLYQSINK